MEAYRTAYVYVRDSFAGTLKETDAGYSFIYDDTYLEGENPTAVSLTLPIQKEEYTSKTLFAFFDGLDGSLGIFFHDYFSFPSALTSLSRSQASTSLSDLVSKRTASAFMMSNTLR